MLKIDRQTITLTRGDTARISLAVKRDGAAYDYSSDTVLFTVKKDVNTADVLLQKTVSEGVITILPTDTASLAYGNYVYDVQLTTQGGDVCTVIEPSRFTVAPEVTWPAPQD